MTNDYSLFNSIVNNNASEKATEEVVETEYLPFSLEEIDEEWANDPNNIWHYSTPNDRRALTRQIEDFMNEYEVIFEIPELDDTWLATCPNNTFIVQGVVMSCTKNYSIVKCESIHAETFIVYETLNVGDTMLFFVEFREEEEDYVGSSDMSIIKYYMKFATSVKEAIKKGKKNNSKVMTEVTPESDDPKSRYGMLNGLKVLFPGALKFNGTGHRTRKVRLVGWCDRQKVFIGRFK
jgi:hypothetical protein